MECATKDAKDGLRLFGLIVGMSLTDVLQIHFRDKRVALCGLERVRMQKDAHVQRRCHVVSPEDLQEALSMTHNPDGPPWEAAALIGMLIIMRIAIYVGLRLKTCSSVDTRR